MSAAPPKLLAHDEGNECKKAIPVDQAVPADVAPKSWMLVRFVRTRASRIRMT